MLPAQRKKVDMSSMTEEEKKLFMLYGKLPTHKNVLTKIQKDRKYFDSGDYALSKAGVAPQSTVGTAIPSPESIPHASPPTNLSTSSSGTPVSTPGIGVGTGTSPVRESSLSTSSTSPLVIDHTVTENIEPPSTSPTSSYPIGNTELSSSPLNPKNSHSISTDSAETQDEAAKEIDIEKVVPGVQKSDLPTAPTPMSGEEADTEMVA
ncbi:hypothetical protein CPB86DRAFT_732984 [Serendipita vermifera]|nr:hypothetical protein CPB86DRAFT_732984 [Serendipita vermifera]